jgi:hypothetical protein
VEAKLRIEYLARVYNRKKDNLSRIFRSIYKERATLVSLDEDILENWKNQSPEAKNTLVIIKVLVFFEIGLLMVAIGTQN